eukprot:12913998-Prorocentrum_lima.AAC.1
MSRRSPSAQCTRASSIASASPAASACCGVMSSVNVVVVSVWCVRVPPATRCSTAAAPPGRGGHRWGCGGVPSE